MARPVLIDIVGRDRTSAAFAKAGASADTLAGRLDRLNARAAAVGKTMTHTLTLPIVAIGLASAKMATDFSTAMTRIHTQAGGTANDVKVLSKQVLDLAKYAEQGPVELAKSLYHLKSVGMDNVSAMKALRAASDLAAVGGASLEETTNALAGAWRTGIKGATDFGKAAATVNAIIGAGNMTTEDWNAALGTGIIPTAKTFGLTLKDVGSALALFTDEGVPADAAATRLRMSLSLLGAASPAAEKQLGKIGLTSLRLAEDMRKPNGIVVAIGDLKKHLDASGLSASKQAQLLSHAFGGGRSSSAILSMVNNWDVLRQKQEQVTRGISKYNAAIKAQRATPAAQFKLLESSLQRAAIIIGNELLPYLVTLARKIGSVAEWFNHLSTATRKWIIISALVLAAVGPVISILTRLYTVGRLVVLSFLKLGAAAVAVSRFAKGLLLMNVGLATYETRAFSAGVATRGFIGQYGKGLGVIGAVALAAYGLGKGISGLVEKNNAWVKVWSHLTEISDAFKSSLLDTKGAINDSARTMAAGQLQSAGLADKAAAAGISLKQLTDGLTGSWSGYNKLIAAWQRGGKPSGDTIAAMLDLRIAFAGAGYDASQLASVTDKAGASLRRVATGTSSLRKGLQNTYAEQVPAAARLADSVHRYHTNAITAVGATTGLGSALGRAALKGQALADALNNIDGGSIGTAEALIAFKQAAHGIGAQLDKNNKTLVGNSAAALQNRSAVLGAVDAAKQHAAALTAQHKGARVVAAALNGDIQSLINQATAAGLSKTQIDKLLTSLGLMPKQVNTALHVTGADIARQAVLNLQAAINALHDKSITITQYEQRVGITGPNGSANKMRDPHPTASGSRSVFGRADGTIPPNTTFTVGEGASHTWEAGRSDSHGRVTIWSNKQSKAMGFRTPTGYAHGTKPDQATLSSNASTAIGDVGSSYSPKFSVVDVGIDRIRKQLAHAWDVLNAQIARGLSKNAATKYKAELQSYAEQARKQLAALRVKINTADLSAIRHALGGVPQDLKDAFKQINQDARQAGKSLAPYQVIEGKLLDKQQAYLKASSRLAGMKDYQNGIKSTLAGAFDASKYGSVGDLIGGLGGAAGKNNKYASQLNKLHKETKGNKTLTAFIDQLAASGDTATLSTLAGASKRDLGKVTTAVGQYNASLNAGGTAATVEKYGNTVAKQTEATDNLRHDMNKLAASLTHPKPVHVHLHVGKEEIADQVFDSHAAGHFLDEIADHVRSGRKG